MAPPMAHMGLFCSLFRAILRPPRPETLSHPITQQLHPKRPKPLLVHCFMHLFNAAQLFRLGSVR